MKFFRRAVVYYAEQSLNAAAYATMPLLALFFRNKQDGEYTGVLLFDGQDNPPKYLQLVLDALRLIAEEDPRHFRRVQREIRSIFFIKGRRSWASYMRCERMMWLDLATHAKWLESHSKEWCTLVIASVIVHEATHGYLFSRRIPYLCIRDRIERICVREQKRFVTRIRREDYQIVRAQALAHGFLDSIRREG